MKLFFYPRLALTNMKRHRKTYIPYLIASIITVSMFYILTALVFTEDIRRRPRIGNTIVLILIFAIFIVIIFSFIFIFYTNSFLMKRRKTEIGLYNILGMQKKHIMCMLFFENIYTIIISIVCGLWFGILFGKLLFLLLLKIILHDYNSLRFQISLTAMRLTIFIFVPIFLSTLISNLWQIHVSNPITLLQGSKIGEKEPKTKWLLTIIGIASITSAYYIAQTMKEPSNAFVASFYVMLLVMLGTYALFTGVSITILKFLKKRKRFYYKTSHFTIISGMLYRMKQNAVGLANICVLSTCVIIMLATTSSLYFGLDDLVSLDLSYKDYTITPDKEKDSDKVISIVQQQFSASKIQIIDESRYHSYTMQAKLTNNVMKTNLNLDIKNVKKVNILLLEEYNQLHHSHITLQSDEILCLNPTKVLYFNKKLVINKKSFTIKDYVDSEKYGVGLNDYNIVIANEQVMKDIYAGYNPKERPFQYNYTFNTNENAEVVISDVIDALDKYELFPGIETRNDFKQEYLLLFGGFLFIGIFLGIEFLLATALIIYYKQISEGYDDKEKYKIMQKVGMSTKEVKKSIHFQILSVFFLPIIVAIIHFHFIFKIITTLLSAYRIINMNYSLV